MKLNVFISCFLAGIWQSVQVSSQFTAFAHGNPHKDNIYQNPQPYAAEHLPYHPQPALHPEPAHPYVAPHPVSFLCLTTLYPIISILLKPH